jgi:uncharacterized protein YceK
MRAIFLMLLVASLAILSGCASTEESDNASVRPWNSPKGWETGLPGGMTEGR